MRLEKLSSQRFFYEFSIGTTRAQPIINEYYNLIKNVRMATLEGANYNAQTNRNQNQPAY